MDERHHERELSTKYVSIFIGPIESKHSLLKDRHLVCRLSGLYINRVIEQGKFDDNK